MKLTAIPAFRDNYVWARHDDTHAILVDPGEAAPILTWLTEHRIRPLAILVTHHHADHVGGILEITARHPVPVYGPANETIPGRSHPLMGGETLTFPELGASFQVIATPGHTRGHIVYFGAGTLFCGDTLFSCGCGRLFEGTAEQMYTSLARIKALPANTQVCSAHEYTLANLDFALAVEPGNADLSERQKQALALRRQNLPTLPVTLASELACNPFLRCEEPDVVVAVAQQCGSAATPGPTTFAALRAWRDTW